MKWCQQHRELEPCPVCRAAGLSREAHEFALAYEVVGPEYQQQFAKDAVALIRRLANEVAGARVASGEARLRAALQRCLAALELVTLAEMGGYPDLFYPQGGWEVWNAEAEAALVEGLAVLGAGGEP